MKIATISDTHSYHREIVVPDADVLICSGDITWKGELSIIEDFCKWMKNLPHKYKIVIFGNHETGLQKTGPKRDAALQMFKDANIIHLDDSNVTIDNRKIYGSSWNCWFHNWEYNVERGNDIAQKWKLIPEDVEILVLHQPPYGTLDMVEEYTNLVHIGCKDLANRINELNKLKVVTFGHYHLDGGKTEIKNNIIYVNAAVCTERYEPINKINVIEI